MTQGSGERQTDLGKCLFLLNKNTMASIITHEFYRIKDKPLSEDIMKAFFSNVMFFDYVR